MKRTFQRLIEANNMEVFHASFDELRTMMNQPGWSFWRPALLGYAAMILIGFAAIAGGFAFG